MNYKSLMIDDRSFILTRNKIDLKYITGWKFHLTNWFCKVKLDLKFIF